MTNPDCYSCKWRGQTDYSYHSKCNHPFVGGKNAIFAMGNTFGMWDFNPLNIKLNSHGLKQGWASFPLDFDVIWLENCDGYEKQ